MTAWDGLAPPYATVVADPPWRYDRGFATGTRTSWKDHAKPLPYSGMSVGEICALPIRDLIAKNARLFLWTTNKYLPDAFAILTVWGASYRQTLVWHKTNPAPSGSVAPCSAEFLLVAVWGAPPVLSKVETAVLKSSGPRTHSQKPPAFLDLVEMTSPGPYLELFARSPRLGWDHWGYGYENTAAG